jgi:hypothetical protein
MSFSQMVRTLGSNYFKRYSLSRKCGLLAFLKEPYKGLLNVLPDSSALVQKAKLPVKDCISFNVTLRLDKTDVN